MVLINATVAGKKNWTGLKAVVIEGSESPQTPPPFNPT